MLAICLNPLFAVSSGDTCGTCRLPIAACWALPGLQGRWCQSGMDLLWRPSCSDAHGRTINKAASQGLSTSALGHARLTVAGLQLANLAYRVLLRPTGSCRSRSKPLVYKIHVPDMQSHDIASHTAHGCHTAHGLPHGWQSCLNALLQSTHNDTGPQAFE